MSVRVMIIDSDPEFRALLMHHVTSHWNDAIITAYDPDSAGNLPAEFSGAGNDMVLLGSRQGERDPLEVVRQFRRVPGFPAILYFGVVSPEERSELHRLEIDGLFPREKLSHDALSVRMSSILWDRGVTASTGSLFVGDPEAGIRPLIKGYRMLRRLSAGDHSAVYLAKRESTGQEVVLKVLRQVPDSSDGLGAFDRFLQEYELIAGLDHEGIVKIHDLGVGDKHAHIAMEYMPGGDLRERIATGVIESDAVSYALQIAEALEQIHAVGILHRDLKPANIMLREDGTLAIIDFGLAKQLRLDAEMTESGEIFGTPYYMSPEQGHAEIVDERSDVYSLGIIFYEMLTGKKPYRANNAMGIIYMHSNAPVPVLPARVSKYQVIINLMLAKKPEDRMQSVAELREWL